MCSMNAGKKNVLTGIYNRCRSAWGRNANGRIILERPFECSYSWRTPCQIIFILDVWLGSLRLQDICAGHSWRMEKERERELVGSPLIGSGQTLWSLPVKRWPRGARYGGEYLLQESTDRRTAGSPASVFSKSVVADSASVLKCSQCIIPHIMFLQVSNVLLETSVSHGVLFQWRWVKIKTSLLYIFKYADSVMFSFETKFVLYRIRCVTVF